MKCCPSEETSVRLHIALSMTRALSLGLDGSEMEVSLSGQSSSQSRFDTASDAGLLDLGHV